MKHLRSICAIVLSLAMAAASAHGQTGASTDLAGLWQAKRSFGPEVAGRLVIDHPASGWRASIAGRAAAVRVTGDSVWFTLPDSSGAFLGRFDARRSRILGHWIQPQTVTDGLRFASPLTLEGCGTGCFAGTVVPRPDELTFWIPIARRPDGGLGAFIRNPERNLARWIRLNHVVENGSEVRFLDSRDSLVAPPATLRDGVLTAYFDGRGGSYDFRRVPDGAFTFFYPRGRPTAAYTYTPPLPRDDGWPVGTLEEVGLSRERITRMVDSLIDAPVDSVGAHKLHALLIARHGRLVLEEYFYGESADKPHDTRSASKVVTSVLIGAAMQQGVRIGPSTPVYATMRPGVAVDARKRALTLEHLITMSSGFDCEDSGNRPGDEDNVMSQVEHPDWYGVILDLNLIRQPGDSAVYCSINPHLAGGVLSRVTGRPLPELMRDLVADPLRMRGYYIPLTPLGDAYMGGGWRFRLRDFMKLGQLYLNGGTWGGRRIVSEEWVRRSVQPRYPMGRSARYGYLWWLMDYPVAGRTLHAYFAPGNGGQRVVVIPELDLVVAAWGGNYNEGAAGLLLSELIPNYIIPAVTGGS